MKMKHMILSISAISSVFAYAFPNVGKIAFRVVTIDERTTQPCENVLVKAVFTDNPTRWGGDSVERVEKQTTNEKGICRFTGTSNHGSASFVVKAMDGYYATPTVRYAETNEMSSVIPISYKCEPYDCVYTTILQRVEHPIPLYVQRAILDGGRNSVGGFDGTNSVLRFDFVVGDWLPPEGKGEYADMTVTTEYKLRDIVKDGKYRIQVFYDFLSRIEFSGPGNGLVEKSTSGQNCGIRIRTASEDGYVPSKAIRFGRRRKITSTVGVYPQYYEDSDSDMNYCFRIRSRYDEAGTLVEAYYGKIYGDFRFKGTDKGGFTGMNFLYYLNPTPNDRNLEWDMKNNLCDKPLRMDYEPIGVRYREP